MNNYLSDNLVNTRDLGGIVNKDGLHIKPYTLIRSGKLYNISQNDVETLKERYHVKTIIDLRTNKAVKEKADVYIDDVACFNVPLTSEKAGITMEANEHSVFASLQQMVKKMGGASKVIDYTCHNYREFVIEEDSISSFKKIFEIITNEQPAILWHCSAGKDRAGVTSALILSALDVDIAQINNDYLLTNECLKENYDSLRAHARAKNYSEEDIEAMSLLGIVDHSYLEAFFDEINKQYGSTDNFLSFLGVDKQALKDKYLEK